MANITTVAKVKTRCSIAPADTSSDELLAYLIDETAHRFEQFLGRVLHRTVGCLEEFAGDARLLQVTHSPVEVVSAWHLLDDEATGWVAVPTAPRYQFQGTGRRMLYLLDTVGTAEQKLRLTYTAGYVFQDEVPGEGQTALPSWVEQAAITQVAHMWQLRDKINVSRVEVTSGIQWSLADWTWVGYVRFALSLLQKHTYLGHS